ASWMALAPYITVANRARSTRSTGRVARSVRSVVITLAPKDTNSQATGRRQSTRIANQPKFTHAQFASVKVSSGEQAAVWAALPTIRTNTASTDASVPGPTPRSRLATTAMPIAAYTSHTPATTVVDR